MFQCCKQCRLAAASILAVLSGGVQMAWAHHSFAMFDRTKTSTIVGTIKDLDWTNPHCWLDVVAPDASGKTATWGFEANGPSELYKAGWRPSAVIAGDKITVVFHPLRDGRPGGSLMSVTLANGTELGAMPKPPPGS